MTSILWNFNANIKRKRVEQKRKMVCCLKHQASGSKPLTAEQSKQ